MNGGGQIAALPYWYLPPDQADSAIGWAVRGAFPLGAPSRAPRPGALLILVCRFGLPLTSIRRPLKVPEQANNGPRVCRAGTQIPAQPAPNSPRQTTNRPRQRPVASRTAWWRTELN